MDAKKKHEIKKNFLEVTEISGSKISYEQLNRMEHRYTWASNFCNNKNVLEVACGSGQGLGILLMAAKSVTAGDITEELVENASKYYKNRANISVIDAEHLPCGNNEVDILIIFEAIYYLNSVERFIEECLRVLRPGGKVLVATANPDLFDFNPSPHSVGYYGVKDLNALFTEKSFECQFFGYLSTKKISIKQKILRPIKKVLVTFNLVPKTMTGKKILKRLIFGKLIEMPQELKSTRNYIEPIRIGNNLPNTEFKVIYMVANLKNKLN